MQVALVQGNVPHPGMHFLGRAEQVLDYHVKEANLLAAQVKAGTLEAAAAGDLARERIRRRPVHERRPTPDPDSGVGDRRPDARRRRPSGPGDRVTNAGLVWSPTTGPGQRYVKRHLVPFGEYIPFRGLIGSWIKETNLVPQDFAPGHTAGGSEGRSGDGR